MNDRTLTYGEKAVGLNFNPSNDPSVQKIKQLYAEIIDFMKAVSENPEDQEVVRLANIAITEVQGAQMWAVKAITYK